MTLSNATTENGIQREFVRSLVRGAYDIQKLRIQTGNRIVANYKTKLGIKPGEKENEDKVAEKILKDLKKDYLRITDGVATEIEGGLIEECKLPTVRKFKASGLISSYTELVLVDQYFAMLRSEAKEFNNLEKVLQTVPIYREYLSKVDGLGVKLSGVIISEIDIHKAEYASSIHAYAGLDVAIIGYYVDKKGEEQTVRAEDVAKFYEDNDLDKTMTVNGYEVQFKSVGRSRKGPCLVKREYVNRDGELDTRDSITFNPWLKTKLIGVLGPSFLKRSRTYVDGKEMGVNKRKDLARSLGWKSSSKSEDSDTEQADAYLTEQGYELEFVPARWATLYYNYRNRIRNMPEHAEKSDAHIHNMAVRFMVKRFLVELYTEWRKLEGLFVADEYSVAKLGMEHGKAKGRPDIRGLQRLISN